MRASAGASAACAARSASRDAGARTTCGPVEARRTHARDRRRDPREIPRARHPRAQHPHPRAAELPALPAGQPDARPGLRPSPGRRLPAQVRARRERGGGGRRLLRAQWHGAHEVAQAAGHRPAGRLRDAVREVPGERPVAGRPGVRRPRARGARHRGAQDRRGHGRGRAGHAQRPRRAAGEALDPELGVVQAFTPACDALVVPNIDEALDEEAAKREFWSAFRVLGEWYEDLPPY